MDPVLVHECFVLVEHDLHLEGHVILILGELAIHPCGGTEGSLLVPIAVRESQNATSNRIDEWVVSFPSGFPPLKDIQVFRNQLPVALPALLGRANAFQHSWGGALV